MLKIWPWGVACVLLGQDDHCAHYEIMGEFTLVKKSDDIFEICGNTSSNRACALIRGE